MRSWHADDRKLWGWGDPEIIFDDKIRPKLWPFFQQELGPEAFHRAPIVAEDEIKLPEPIVNQTFIQELKTFLSGDHIHADHGTRLRHSFGESYRDLLRLRKGIVEGSPDLVLYPGSHEDCVRILTLARKHNVCCIPFGGGTNIFRMLEREPDERRMVVTLDTRRMNKLVKLDVESQTATFECGIFGPDLDNQLEPHGFHLGHLPDSYQLSTLGGWIATRSAGMFSSNRGKIEDMVISLKVATPEGEIVTKPTPAASAGPDLKNILIGSEGTLGVITEATVRIRPIPEVLGFQTFLYPDFDSGIKAAKSLVKEGCLPSLLRLMDDKQMQFVSSLAHAPSTQEQYLKKAIGWYLTKIKHFDSNQQCMMFTCAEGSKREVAQRNKTIRSIAKLNQAFCLGSGPAAKWYEEVYNFGYFRDFVYYNALIGDAAETSTVWSNLMPLYHRVHEAVRQAYREMGIKGYCGCHLSHAYETGASLYYIMVFREKEGYELEQHRFIRDRVTQAILDGGGTLSHHHSVGRELKPFMQQEHGDMMIRSLQEFKRVIDPQSILNPGTLLP